MKHIILFFAAALGAFCNAKAQQDVLKTIEENNIELQLARTQGAKAVLEIKAQNGLDPTEVEYSPFFTKGISGMSSSELIVSQSFDLPWAYTSRSRLATLTTTANDAAYNALRQDVLLRARNLCIELCGLREALGITDKRLAIADSLVTLYQKRLDRGDATALDLNSIRIERIRVAKERIELHTAITKAQAALNALNGGKEIQLNTTSASSFINAETTLTTASSATLSATASTATDARSAAAEEALKAARQRERVASGESLPRLSLGYRRNTDLESSSHGVLIGASIPLFSNQKRRTIARREREAAELQQKQTETEIANERLQLQAELQQAADILAVSDPTLVQESLTLLRKSLSYGDISLPNYLQQAAPLYEQLQSVIATRTLYLQTLSSLRRAEL